MHLLIHPETAGLRWHRRPLSLGFIAMVVLQVCVVAASATDWPQFLGPDRTGISSETGLIDAWPKDGLDVVFRVSGGVGMSGISIQGDNLCTLVQHDGSQFALMLDAKTGEKRWETAVAPEFENPMGHGPRAAPTIVGDRVLVFTGEGVLSALSLADGKILWSHAVTKELGGKTAEYGMACSPLVVGKQVIVTAGCPDATVVAYDLESGKQRWTAGQDRAGYSSPALLKIGDESQIVVFSGTAVLGLQPETGNQLWRFPYETDYDCNIVTPTLIDGNVFVSSGENHGSVLLSVRKAASGYQVDEVWSSQGRKSVLRNEWQTSVLLEGHLYGFDNVGGAGPITHLTCIKAATGERVWQQLRFGKGNLIAADGKLLITTMDGEFVIVKATPVGFEEVGRESLIGMTRQAPSLAGGKVYLRDDREIVCIDLRKSKP